MPNKFEKLLKKSTVFPPQNLKVLLFSPYLLVSLTHPPVFFQDDLIETLDYNTVRKMLLPDLKQLSEKEVYFKEDFLRQLQQAYFPRKRFARKAVDDFRNLVRSFFLLLPCSDVPSLISTFLSQVITFMKEKLQDISTTVRGHMAHLKTRSPFNEFVSKEHLNQQRRRLEPALARYFTGVPEFQAMDHSVQQYLVERTVQTVLYIFADSLPSSSAPPPSPSEADEDEVEVGFDFESQYPATVQGVKFKGKHVFYKCDGSVNIKENGTTGPSIESFLPDHNWIFQKPAYLLPADRLKTKRPSTASPSRSAKQPRLV
jgi:hypothetical protein